MVSLTFGMRFVWITSITLFHHMTQVKCMTLSISLYFRRVAVFVCRQLIAIERILIVIFCAQRVPNATRLLSIIFFIYPHIHICLLYQMARIRIPVVACRKFI